MLLLVTNLHEKKHDRKSGQTKFWQHMHYFQFAIWCYNFALVLQYCICVTWKMHTIFSCILLEKKSWWGVLILSDLLPHMSSWEET